MDEKFSHAPFSRAHHGASRDGPVPGATNWVLVRRSKKDFTTTLNCRARQHGRLAGDRSADERNHQGQAFVQVHELTIDAARAKFVDQPFKVDQINALAAGEIDEHGNAGANAATSVSTYTHDKFVDLCRGPHVSNTGEIPIDALKLLSIAGATGVGAKRIRNSRASTAQSGNRKKNWTTTCGGSKKRKNATIANWAKSSACSISPMTSDLACRSSHPKAKCPAFDGRLRARKTNRVWLSACVDGAHGQGRPVSQIRSL